jgi:hypothetical protein
LTEANVAKDQRKYGTPADDAVQDQSAVDETKQDHPILGEWIKVTEGCGSKDFQFATGQELVITEKNREAVKDLIICGRAVYRDIKTPNLK